MRPTRLTTFATAAAAAVAAASLAALCVATRAHARARSLPDDVYVEQQTVEAGEHRHFHWRLTNWNQIKVSDEARPDIRFRLLSLIFGQEEPATGNGGDQEYDNHHHGGVPSGSLIHGCSLHVRHAVVPWIDVPFPSACQTGEVWLRGGDPNGAAYTPSPWEASPLMNLAE